MKKILLLFGCLSVAQAIPWEEETELDKYVHREDGHFKWHHVSQLRYNGVTLYVVNMTSQKWQDETFSSVPIWWHIMGIAVPDEIKYYDSGILYISGSDNEDNTTPPDWLDLDFVVVATLANDTNTVAAVIRQVPNQPIVFANDPTQRSRYEDAIIAWSWRTYIDNVTAPLSVVLRMPMTKAAKRGLDTIYEVAKEINPLTNIQRFGVGGPSKRGWTTWSLAATDQRVVAMFPMVFSMLNCKETFMNHYRNLDGAWSFAFEPYWRENLTQEMFNPRTAEILQAEDMWLFRERLTMPKLEMLSSGDEFFLSDESMHWWNDIPDPKYMLMLENAEHTMAPHYVKIYETAVSFWLTVMEGSMFPYIAWQNFPTEQGGYILFTTQPEPVTITAWSAVTHENDTRRDFRLAEQAPDGSLQLHRVRWYENLEVIKTGVGEYMVSATVIDGEWLGFFVQGTWEGPTGYRMIFTSQNYVIPETWPHEPCTDGNSCYGKLV